jgi:hypothetical protein
MNKAIEATTDPIDQRPIASKKRAWIWALILCGSAVAATAYFYSPTTQNKVTKTAQATTAPAQQKFTLSAGDTVVIITGDDDDSSWRVLIVPSHGQSKTIYYGDNNKAVIIYDLAIKVQLKANETGKAQIFTLPNDINQSINK